MTRTDEKRSRGRRDEVNPGWSTTKDEMRKEMSQLQGRSKPHKTLEAAWAVTIRKAQDGYDNTHAEVVRVHNGEKETERARGQGQLRHGRCILLLLAFLLSFSVFFSTYSIV